MCHGWGAGWWRKKVGLETMLVLGVVLFFGLIERLNAPTHCFEGPRSQNQNFLISGHILGRVSSAGTGFANASFG
jgi:hypothetical protein